MQKFSKTSSVPLIRWAGSKRKLLPLLLAKMPRKFDRYIEPFAGSACLFFAAEPRNAILADLNPELIAAYRTITKHPIRVLRLAQSFPATAKSYYFVRDQLPNSKSQIYRAARFLYLNRFCFNAIYRTNKKGHFNIPFGSRTGGFPADDTFRRAALALGRAALHCGDFEKTVSLARTGDFIYIDPPYVTAHRVDRNEYGPGSFNAGDIPRLVQCLKKLHNMGVRFLLSYCDCPDLLRLLPRTVAVRVRVKRHVAATPNKRRVVTELLIDNADMFGSFPSL